jgi:hypothetical protein
LQINIAVDQIAVGLELSLLLLIIMGRWFLPKAESLSRTALSQLLLVYMSLASDMVDLLSLLNEVQVQESSVMHFFTLSIFSWGLFQFSLNLIINNKDENNLDNLDNSSANSSVYDNTKEENTISEYFMSCFNFSNEIWSILISLIFQDGPFLALRLTAVFRFNVRTFTTMFFTCKNGIILFIQCYRLFAICTEKKQENNKKHDIDLKVNNRENIL